MIEVRRLSYLGDLNEANEILEENIELSTTFSEIHNDILLTLGINYTRLSSYDKAMDYLLKSIQFSKDNDNNNILVRSYIALGLLYNKLNEFKKEREYLFLSLEILEDDPNSNVKSNIYNNLSSSFLLDSNYNDALKYIQESIKINLKNNDLSSAAIAFHNKGTIYYYLGEMDKCMNSFQESLELKKQIGNKAGIGTTNLALAQLNHEIKNYDKAKEFAFIALEIFNELKMLRKMTEAYKVLKDIFSNKNEFDSAIIYAEKYYNLKDSIFSESRHKIISELESKYKLAEKEKENQFLLRKSEEKTYIIIIILIFLLAIIVIPSMQYYKNKTTEKLNIRLNEKKEKIENQNTELEKLNNELLNTNKTLNELNATKDKFFSIISHDLKGPMSSHYQVIEMLIENYENISEKERLEYLDLLHDSSKNTFNLLENLLTWSNTQKGNIKFEPQSINIKNIADNVINIVKSMSQIKNISVNNLITEDIYLNADATMLSTIIRNLTINAIKFTNEGGLVEIGAENNNNETVIFVKDNGIGMSQERIDKLFKIDKAQSTKGTNKETGTGLGLIICKEFVEKHNGNIWVDSKVDIGTKFSFTIPDNKKV